MQELRGLGVVNGIELDVHAGLVTSTAVEVARKCPRRIRVEELLTPGWQGLRDAAERFDPGRGLKFATFARWRVRGAMQDYLRAVDPLSRGDRKEDRVVLHAWEDVYGERGARAETEPAARLEHPGCEDLALELFRALKPRQRLVARWRWVEEMTQEEVGSYLGITGAAVSHIEREIRIRLGAPGKGMRSFTRPRKRAAG